ncbi:MAG: hypothetical protein ABI330_08640 [Caldimonas sp.]|nr:hypothetical protein [Pseudomonadota bacterium]
MKATRSLRVLSVRSLVVWCLLLALPYYGFSATATELLGANHVHVDVASSDAMSGWIDFRRSDHLAEMSMPPRHTHSVFQRHHHDPSDTSVVSLDGASLGGAAGDGGSPTSGSVVLVLALASPICIAMPGWSEIGWQTDGVIAFDSVGGKRLERPPQVV